MKRMIGLLMVMGLMVGVGCGGDSDSPTGPSNEVTKGPDGQTLEVGTRKWDNGNIKVEFQYFKDIEDNGMHATGINSDTGLVEIIELKNHPWFIGVQFHPEYKSTVLSPHPLFVSFIAAATKHSNN